MKRIFAMLLILLFLVSCGEPIETVGTSDQNTNSPSGDVTDAPETDAPETDAPEEVDEYSELSAIVPMGDNKFKLTFANGVATEKFFAYVASDNTDFLSGVNIVES